MERPLNVAARWDDSAALPIADGLASGDALGVGLPHLGRVDGRHVRRRFAGPTRRRRAHLYTLIVSEWEHAATAATDNGFSPSSCRHRRTRAKPRLWQSNERRAKESLIFDDAIFNRRRHRNAWAKWSAFSATTAPRRRQISAAARSAPSGARRLCRPCASLMLPEDAAAAAKKNKGGRKMFETLPRDKNANGCGNFSLR